MFLAENPLNKKLLSEDCIAIQDVAFLFPESNRPSRQTLNRWTSKGCRGAVLESMKIGGRLVTSREAVQRFLDAIE